MNVPLSIVDTDFSHSLLTHVWEITSLGIFRRVQILSPHYSAFCLTVARKVLPNQLIWRKRTFENSSTLPSSTETCTRHVQDIYTRCNGWSFSRSSVLGSQMLLTVVKKAICKLKVYSWAGMYELSLWDETCKPHHIVTTQRSPFVICSCFFLPFLHPEPFVVLFGLPVLFAEPGFGGVLCARAGELLDIFGLSNLINLLGVLQSIAFF